MQTIDRIEEIRSRNNANWMDLLRLALELDPVRTKIILKRIIARDKEVTAAAERLINEPLG